MYAVAHCKTLDGTLVNLLHGAQLRETSAMARGTRLESQVLHVVSQLLKVAFQLCGLITNPNHPIFGASPDGINDEFVVEIKCPTNDRTYFTFIDTAGKSNQKCHVTSFHSYICFHYR